VYKTTKDVPFPRIDALSEIDFLERLKHPNIPNLIDKIIYVRGGIRHFAASLPYCGVQLSRDIIKSIEKPMVGHLLVQYFSALAYIHDLDILHCDIKQHNVLVDPDNGFKLNLIDFGLSLVIQTPKQIVSTSRMYADDFKPPEVMANKTIKPCKSMDVYASGVMLAFLGITSYASPLLAYDPEDRPDAKDIISRIQDGEWVIW
jgi:serine/threonine protein kinase